MVHFDASSGVGSFCGHSGNVAAEARVTIVYDGGTLQQSGMTTYGGGSFDITFSI